jgi:diguanylate cyclase (GGDEF)-like protein
MARFSLFPIDDREQRVRFRRYLIAAATSLLVVALLGVCVLMGALDPRPFAIAAGVVVAAISGFLVLFRSALNLRSRDPSLTVPMMVTAICVVSYSLYHLGEARATFLLLYPMVMFFGVFRLSTQALLIVGAFILLSYALVIALLAQQPAGLDPVQTELLRGLVLATVLLWFAFMGGYVHELRRRLRESGYDRLTGTQNRGRVLDALAHEKNRCDRGAGPLSVCLADIDLFKSINDTHGHPAGDRVLQTFAKTAQEELRAIDFIGRYGGDEFLLVLTGTPLEGARECAERIRRRMALLKFFDPVTNGSPTVSIGATQYVPGEALLETLQRADAALYRAKSAGRNRVECG